MGSNGELRAVSNSMRNNGRDHRSWRMDHGEWGNWKRRVGTEGWSEGLKPSLQKSGEWGTESRRGGMRRRAIADGGSRHYEGGR